MRSWVPDTCPDSPACEFEIGTGAIVRRCAFHATAGASYDTVAARNREKNRAVTVAAPILAVEAGAIAFLSRRDGSISLLVGRTRPVRDSVQAAVDLAVGSGRITVE